MILFALMLIPLVFAMLVVISPAAQAKTIATVGSFVSLAGAIYAATGSTNSPAASAALQTAIVNANTTISDLVNLIRTFGVKL